MSRKRFILFTLVILNLVIPSGCADSTDPSLSFSTIEQGSYSLVNDARQVIVRDQMAWEKLWAEHTPKKPVFTIDFTSDMVIGVFLGFPSSGSSVTITSIHFDSPNLDTTSRGPLVVEYITAKPGRNCVMADMITQPFHLVKVARYETEVIFNGILQTVDC